MCVNKCLFLIRNGWENVSCCYMKFVSPFMYYHKTDDARDVSEDFNEEKKNEIGTYRDLGPVN